MSSERFEFRSLSDENTKNFVMVECEIFRMLKYFLYGIEFGSGCIISCLYFLTFCYLDQIEYGDHVISRVSVRLSSDSDQFRL